MEQQSGLKQWKEPPSDTIQKKLQETLRTLQQPSEHAAKNGVNALDLIPSTPVTPETFAKAKVLLEANFGTEFQKEKWLLLTDLIDEEGWSEERFMRTFKWFLKNKSYPSWTISDWFQYSVKVYPYQWYVDQCSPYENVLEKMDKYKLPNGTIVYKWKDGEDLPFERPK